MEALGNGSYGSEHNEERIQERSHFGAKDLWTGLSNSNELISSEMIGSDPMLLSDLNFKLLEIVDL